MKKNQLLKQCEFTRGRYSRCLQVGIILIRERESSGLSHLGLVLGHKGLVNLDLRRSKGRGGYKLKGRVANELSSEPKERLLEVVVGFGRNVIVLKVLLSVESNCLCLDLSLLDIDLVTTEHDRDVFTDTDEITVPVGNVLVSNTGGDIEHDDAALTIDVVSVTETAKLFLASSIPDLKLDLTVVGEEAKGMDLDTLGGNILFLKLTSQVTLDKGSLIKELLELEDGSDLVD